MSDQAPRRRRDEQGERGAVAIIVAISLVLMFGVTAFAVDAGNLWQKRRGLIQATDSAALAAAAAYGNPQDPNYSSGCSLAPDYVTNNDANATMTSCENHVLGDGSGYVTVNAHTPVHFTFAPVIGIGDRNVSSSTTAAYGRPRSVRGLRPIGLCATNPEYGDWLASDKQDPLTVTIPLSAFGQTVPPCKDSKNAGNWSFLILDGNANSSNTLTQQWFLQGCQCLVDSGTWLHGTPGGDGNSLTPFINPILGKRIDVPVYDGVNCSSGGFQPQPAAFVTAAGGPKNTTTTTSPSPTTTAAPSTTTPAPTTTTTPGGGQNCQYHVIGFVGIKINSYKLNGQPDQRYFNVTFITHVTTGQCCAGGGDDTGERVVFVCAVDATFDPSNCAQP
jgi:Flp pilus assembly protein TadG